jgi:hypothetical protein
VMCCCGSFPPWINAAADECHRQSILYMMASSENAATSRQPQPTHRRFAEWQTQNAQTRFAGTLTTQKLHEKGVTASGAPACRDRSSRLFLSASSACA